MNYDNYNAITFAPGLNGSDREDLVKIVLNLEIIGPANKSKGIPMRLEYIPK